MKEINVQRNDDENLVPSIWRYTFHQIIAAFKNENYSELIAIPHLTFVSKDEMQQIISNIENYGSHLTDLPEETWNTSVCRWQGGDVWDVLIDLYTQEEVT